MVCKSHQKYGLVRAYREVCMSIAETESNIIMFNKMIRGGVSTNDIRHFSVKQAAQCRIYTKTNLHMEKIAMKHKRKDALAFVKRLRQEKHRTKLSLEMIYEDDRKKVRTIIDRINRRASDYKVWLKEAKQQKIDHLIFKRQIDCTNARSLSACPPRVKALLEKVDIFDREKEIVQEPPESPMICHPDIKLTECELMILNKGPKFMVRRNVRLDEFCLEMEKSITKQNYNDIYNNVCDDGMEEANKEDDTDSDKGSLVDRIEAESKMIYNMREKTISLSRLKSTDYKYNKRIQLPEQTDVNREAQHQIRREEMIRAFRRVVRKTQSTAYPPSGRDHLAEKKNKRETDNQIEVISELKKQINREIEAITHPETPQSGKKRRRKRKSRRERKKAVTTVERADDPVGLADPFSQPDPLSLRERNTLSTLSPSPTDNNITTQTKVFNVTGIDTRTETFQNISEEEALDCSGYSQRPTLNPQYQKTSSTSLGKSTATSLTRTGARRPTKSLCLDNVEHEFASNEHYNEHEEEATEENSDLHMIPLLLRAPPEPDEKIKRDNADNPVTGDLTEAKNRGGNDIKLTVDDCSTTTSYMTRVGAKRPINPARTTSNFPDAEESLIVDTERKKRRKKKERDAANDGNLNLDLNRSLPANLKENGAGIVEPLRPITKPSNENAASLDEIIPSEIFLQEGDGNNKNGSTDKIQKNMRKREKSRGASTGVTNSTSKKETPTVLRTDGDKYIASNLTKKEKDGLKSLTNRVKEGEIAVATSDKSNKFVVLKKPQYLESGLKHTKEDRMVDQEDVKRIQTILNSHTKWFIETFSVGDNWNHRDRMIKNVTENGEQTCPMVCLIKDHKGWSYSESTPVPPSRPVIGGNVGINRGLSELLSLLIEPVTSMLGGDAIESTGDMLSKIDEINKSDELREAFIKERKLEDLNHMNNTRREEIPGNCFENKDFLRNRVEKLRNSTIGASPIPDIKNRLIATGLIDRISGSNPIPLPDCGGSHREHSGEVSVQEKGFVLVGSDVEKLYPSLRPLEAARLTRLAILESEIDIIDVDHRKALRYIYVVGGVELLDRAGLLRLTPKWLGSRSDLLAIGGIKTNDDKYWKDSTKQIHRKEARMIVATMMEIGILVVMSTHLYTFNGVTFIQLLGGPIGLRLTAALANLVMAYFDRALKLLLLRENIKVPLSFRFVDDSRFGLQPIRPGWRWESGRLIFKESEVEKDIAVGPQRRTTLIMNEILNSIVEYLKFTTEDNEDFENNKLPTLDCQIWIENGKIMHQFYEKPQVPNRMLLHNTALSATSLTSSIVQEGVRRLLNTSTTAPEHVKTQILNKFASKLVNSGFSRDDTEMFLVHSATSYIHKVMLSELPKDHTKYKPLYLSKEYRREERALTKARAKTNWFKSKSTSTESDSKEKKENKHTQSDSWKTLLPREWRKRCIRQRNIAGTQVTTVMTVPNTCDGMLLNNLIQKEAQLCKLAGYCIKLVEGNGVPLNRMFPAPIANDFCDRLDECSVCRLSSRASKCTVRSVVYVAECLKCWDTWYENGENVTEANKFSKATARRMIYLGETSRSLRERSGEHMSGAKRLDEKNFISKHWLTAHKCDDSPPDFVFRVYSCHNDPLSREVYEAVMIQKVNADEGITILNSKSEWNSSSLSRLCIDKKEWEKRKELEEYDALTIKNKLDARKFKELKKSTSFDGAVSKLLLKSNKDRASSSPQVRVTNDTSPISDFICAPKLTTSGNNFRNFNIINNRFSKCSRYRKRKISLPRPAPDTFPAPVGTRDPRASSAEEFPERKRRKFGEQSLEAGDILDVDMENTIKQKDKFGGMCHNIGSKCDIIEIIDNGSGASNSNDLGMKRGTMKNGYLWELRSLLPVGNHWEDLNDYMIGTTELNLPIFLGEVTDPEDYTTEIPSDAQDDLTRTMCNLRIEKKETGTDEDLGLDSEIDPSVMKFVKLLSQKLDDAKIPNLFGTVKNPTSNLIIDMLQCHKLRSTFDFELAIARKWDLDNSLRLEDSNTVTGSSNFRWNFRVLDMAAGSGTTVDTVFALKSAGIFRGAKRKLKFEKMAGEPKQTKCGKMEEINKLMESMEVCNKNERGKEVNFKQCKRGDVKFNISNSRPGWHGFKKTPPKCKISPQKSLTTTSDTKVRPHSAVHMTTDAAHEINWQGKRGRAVVKKVKTPVTPGRQKLPQKTPRKTSYKGKIVTETPDKGQSLILDYVHSTQKDSKGGQASNGKRAGTLD